MGYPATTRFTPDARIWCTKRTIRSLPDLKGSDADQIAHGPNTAHSTRCERLWGSLQIFSDVELNVMHRAILIHGRDSRIARLLRGDSSSKIEKAMRLGFDTFRRNVNWQMAIQKKCHMAALHALHTHLNEDVPELRKKIVHLALFR